MNRLILLLALCLPLAAQNRFFATTGDVSLTASTTKFTIQQPANTSTGSKTISLETAVVYCSVACDITQDQNGTAATATAGTINKINPSNVGSAATVFTASNAGTGTSAAGTIHNQAANTLVIDLSKIKLPRGGSNINYNINISSITGTANITLYWNEPE